ncbi:hypothetical protein F5Y15DRAFT_245709 [Xylariaceae sp. FL0016]|nr:hypothetical protein F5Y15DRAFT_245709 [Xylariaceae sp. FL0016]
MAEISSSSGNPASSSAAPPSPLPRITIRFCTQCKWMLRAAYFAQELLSTFSTALGEVALQPTTGGVFIVEIAYSSTTPSRISTDVTDSTIPPVQIQSQVLWDRKIDGGFPETKELKRRVRDVIEPDRNLGHVDRDYPRPQGPGDSTMPSQEKEQAQGHGQTQPSGPRWPRMSGSSSSSSSPAPSQALEPATTDTNVGSTSASRSAKDLGPHPNHGDAGGPAYKPRMAGGGVMPLAPPGPKEKKPDEARQSGQDECEDCQ